MFVCNMNVCTRSVINSNEVHNINSRKTTFYGQRPEKTKLERKSLEESIITTADHAMCYGLSTAVAW